MILDGNQYRMIVENSPNLLWRSGTEGPCDYFNTTWLEFTGRTMEQEMGTGWAEGVHPDDLDRCLKIYTESFAKRVTFEMNYRLRRFDGEWRWINDRGTPFYDDDGEFQGYIGSCMDINEQINGELWKTMAQKDGLTGINNRQYFEQLARDELAKSIRYKKELCLVMIDIDHFKSINDHYGHQTGDSVIQDFAKFLKNHLREFDILGRYGGDEFVVMLPDTTYDGAVQLVNRLNDLIKKNIVDEGHSNIQLSFSSGISSLTDETTFESFLSKADKEMYTNKSNKKGFSPEFTI